MYATLTEQLVKIQKSVCCCYVQVLQRWVRIFWVQVSSPEN